MLTCSCGSTRILSVSGKTNDMCVIAYGAIDRDGYVPHGLGIGGGDYLEFDLCLECGKHQGDYFPISEEKVSEILKNEH